MIALATSLLAALVAAPDRAELKAKPGGTIRFDYGAPAWQDRFEEQIVEGLSWRLSAGSENRLDTKAALVFEDTVVFPGKYNVGALCRGEPEWDLVFHHDGVHYGNGPHSGMVNLEGTTLPDGERAKKLEIDFAQEQGTYRLDIRFGKRALSTPFRTAATKAVKGKAGRHAFTSTFLLRDDIEEMNRLLDESEITIARIESKQLEHAVRVRIRGGDAVEAVYEREDPRRADVFVDGVVSPAKRPSAVVQHAVVKDGDGPALEFTIGDNTYRYPLPEKLFERREVP